MYIISKYDKITKLHNIITATIGKPVEFKNHNCLEFDLPSKFINTQKTILSNLSKLAYKDRNFPIITNDKMASVFDI
jgi:hypothetical protein